MVKKGGKDVIFEQDNLAFRILDVSFFDQESYYAGKQRRFIDCLSFRFTADSVLESNGCSLKLSANTVLFGPANVAFSGRLKNDKRIVIHFKLLNFTSDIIEVYTPSNPERLAELFTQAYECWTKKEASYKHQTAAILNLIFAEIYEDNNSVKASNSKIANSIRYINQNLYSSDLSMSVAAKKSFVSDAYFRRLFRKEFGTSPKEYVIGKRIEHATSLILAGGCTLKEVAALSGYKDYKLFFTEFKRLTGKAPSQYSHSLTRKSND